MFRFEILKGKKTDPTTFQAVSAPFFHLRHHRPELIMAATDYINASFYIRQSSADFPPLLLMCTAMERNKAPA